MVRQLSVFRRPVLHHLQRHPSDRISMDRFHDLCGKAFSAQSAKVAVRTEIKALTY